jgi:hypothetical protein
MLIRPLIIGYLIFLFSGLTFAQTGPSLRVIIESTDKAAEDCGVRESSLRGLVGFVMNSARIRQADSNEFGINTLYVSTNIIFNERINVCYGNIRVEVYGYTASDLRNDPLGGFVSEGRMTVLCLRGGLTVGPQGTFSGSLSQMAENATKQCLGRLKY